MTGINYFFLAPFTQAPYYIVALAISMLGVAIFRAIKMVTSSTAAMLIVAMAIFTLALSHYNVASQHHINTGNALMIVSAILFLGAYLRRQSPGT